MALAESPLPVFQRGDWPGPLTLRRGWARAEARPWNDVVPDAVLRLIRGGSSFVEACTDLLLQRGAPSVFSPPLAPSARRSWEHAGYHEFLKLALMRRSLDEAIRPPDHLVVAVDGTDLTGLLQIDRAAFTEFWRFDIRAIEEAMSATARSSAFIVRNAEGRPAAYAIVGYGHAISYLQRVAVDPAWQGRGMGRSLVRVAARSARAAGARAMLLNTQFDNEAAMALYRSEGYVTLSEPLALLRFG